MPGKWILLAGVLVATGCAELPKRPDREEFVRDPKHDAFARAEALAAGNGTPLQPTALMPGAVDAVVVERMLRQRMGEATAAAMRDLMAEAAGKANLALPVKDLLTSLQGMMSQASEVETRSQALLASLLRNGLTVAIANLAKEGHLRVDGCPVDEVLSTVYEGLAASSFLRPLSFTVAGGKVHPKCKALAATVSEYVDAAATVGLGLDRFGDIAEGVRRVVSDCSTVPTALAPELQVAILEVTQAARPVDASRTVDDLIRELDLARLRDLKVLVRRYRNQGVSGVWFSNGDANKCLQALEYFALRFDGAFEPLGVRRGNERLKLSDLEATVRDLYGRMLSKSPSDTDLAQAVAGLLIGDLQKATETLKTGSEIASCAKLAAVTIGDYQTLLAAPVSAPCNAQKPLFDKQFGELSDKLFRSIDKKVNAEEALRKAESLSKELSASMGKMAPLQPVLVALVQNQPLRREQIVRLASALHGTVRDACENGVLKEVVDAVFEIVPEAIREERASPAGLRLDVPSLASGIAARYTDKKRPGLYLRATVGSGYLYTLSGPLAGIGPQVSEELGVGFRWQLGNNSKFLHGPHLMASGLLYKVAPTRDTRDTVFAGLGWSLNIYRLVDLSFNVGPKWRWLEDGSRQWGWAMGMGLQLPLADYLAEVLDSSETSVTSGGSGH